MTRKSTFLVIVLVASTTGCKTTSTLFCDENTPCTDPARPFCDLEGDFPESDGHGRTCIADPFDGGVPCEASETVCSADLLVECDASGNVTSQTDCPLGCHDTEVRCNKLDPSNGLAPHLDDAETEGADIILGDGATFNTTTGVVRNGDGSIVAIPSVLLPAPDGGSAIRVFKFKSLSLGDTSVFGSAAVAILSAGDIDILGTVAIEPGTGVESSVCPPATQAGGVGMGAGGGGFGTSGADGGDGGLNGLGGPGLSANGGTSLVPLRAGCNGAMACVTLPLECVCDPPCLGFPFGGGAAQISSDGHIRLGVTGFSGAVHANAAAAQYSDSHEVGYGGGSGGGLLLEAASVIVGEGSAIVANGAGGSCGTNAGGGGSISGDPNGANCPGAEFGNGGNGATNDRLAQAGLDGTDSGGGGGGGLGRVRINTRDSGFSEAGTLSPQPFISSARIR